MRASNFEISPIELPIDVAELRRSSAAIKVLELYGITQPFFDPEVDADAARVLRYHMKRSVYVAHELTDTDDVFGFISHQPDFDTSSLLVHHLAVHENHRKRGIGSALLQVAERDAEAFGFGSVTLKTVSTAKRFYTRQGYELVDRFDRIMQLRVPRR